MLALDIELVGPTYEAGLGGERPEWPPHPARVFCALVAAADPGTADDDALRWLEEQRAPTITYPAATTSVLGAYVPTNATGGGKHDTSQQYVGRTSGGRLWPRALPARGLVRMEWDESSPSEVVLGRLRRLAKRVPYLGRASSPVLLTFSDSSDAPRVPTLLPADEGGVLLRVAYRGYLSRLRRAHDLGQPASTVESASPYAPPRPAPSVVVDQAPPAPPAYGAMVALGLPPGQRIDARHALPVAMAWKAAVLQRLGRPHPDDPWDPLREVELALLHGHHDGRRRQVPFMVLPWVGTPHARGDILGVAVALSGDLDNGVRRALLQLFGLDRDDGPRLRSVVVPGLRQFELRTPDGRSTLEAARWQGPSRIWRSVLPVILDRWPKRNYAAEDVVADGCVMAGHPRPADVTIRPNSAVPGAPSLARRDVRRRSGPSRPAVHAVVRFAQPVRGPVVVGHLRHLGLGLFLPEVR